MKPHPKSRAIVMSHCDVVSHLGGSLFGGALYLEGGLVK